MKDVVAGVRVATIYQFALWASVALYFLVLGVSWISWIASILLETLIIVAGDWAEAKDHRGPACSTACVGAALLNSNGIDPTSTQQQRKIHEASGKVDPGHDDRCCDAAVDRQVTARG
jgi:hypothetical protein